MLMGLHMRAKKLDRGDILMPLAFIQVRIGALGDGGAITTDSDELAHKIKVLRNYGSQEKNIKMRCWDTTID